MFHFSLYFALFATIVLATSRCEIVERGVQGFEAKFYNYEWKDQAGWGDEFFKNGGYNKNEALHTVSGVQQINFGFCDYSHELRYGKIYGQQTTMSNYTIELTGYFTPTSTGDHLFYVKAENGVSLQVSRGLSCCNTPDGDKSGDYELQMLDNGHGDGNEAEKDLYLEYGVPYFIKIVTFNWHGSGGLKVGFFTPLQEHRAEMGTMVFQGKYDTSPCLGSPSNIPESPETLNEFEKKTECSLCTEIATAPKDSETTSTELTTSTMETSSGEILESIEPEVSPVCESCSLTNSKEPSVDAHPTDVIIEKTSEKSTGVVSSTCIDIELALLDIFSTSKQAKTLLEHLSKHLGGSGPSTSVPLSTEKVSQETMDTTSQGKEEPKETQDVPNEKATATSNTKSISELEPSVSPVSAGSILPGSVDKSVKESVEKSVEKSADKSVDATVAQNTQKVDLSASVSASVDFSGKIPAQPLSKDAVPSSISTNTSLTKPWTLSQVESSHPEATTSIEQQVNLSKVSTENATITSCTEDCKVETSTTYVTMTTTNERQETVTVTYCPSTNKAQPLDICIANDSVCLSYALSVNVYPTPAPVNNSKAKPSAAVSETRKNKVTETATTCTEDCKVETSTTYVTMTTTNEREETVTVTYCPSTDQAQPLDMCIADDSVCLSYAASVNVYPASALVSSSKATEPGPSAAGSETKEDQVMEAGRKTESRSSSPSSSNTAANLQPAQSVETGSPAKVTSSGNSKETTSVKDTSRFTPEETVSVTITSTTRSNNGSNSLIPVTGLFENGAAQIGAFASFNVLISLAAALMSLLVLA